MRPLARHAVRGGFNAGTNPVTLPSGILARGSKNLLAMANGKNVQWKGTAALVGVEGSRFLANTPNGSYAGLGNKTTAGIGSIIGLISNAMGFIGAGPLNITGASRSVSASTALQILLYKSSSYSGAGTGPITAGLDPPSAPTVAEHSVTTSTINSGTMSARIWFVRSSTGGRSRASTPSATIVVDGKKVRLTVQGADLTYASTAGADRLGIGLTQWGFGFSGPHYEYIEIAISNLTTVDGTANSYELEYSSADLIGKDLAPIDDYPPPAGVFAVAMEDVVAIIGCYGDLTTGVSATNPGTAIAVSLPVFIESFPPDNLLFLPEAPVGVLSRASDGFSFVGCKNSMHALLYTGGSPALSLRTIWPNTGIQAAHNMCLGEGGRLYAASAKRGLVRIGEDGEPDAKFAEPVADITSTWTMANVVTGWDNDHQLVVFAHSTSMLAYNVQTGEWSALLDATGITGSFVAAVTQNGGLILSSNDGSATMPLYSFNEGSGKTWEAFLPPVMSDDIADTVMEVLGVARFDSTSTVTVKVFTNGNTSTAAKTMTFTPGGTGPQHFPPESVMLRPNVRKARSHQLYISQVGIGGDAGIDYMESRGLSSGVI